MNRLYLCGSETVGPNEGTRGRVERGKVHAGGLGNESSEKEVRAIRRC